MRNKKPPFEITEAALSDVMAIGELVGKISSTPQLSSGPILRRENRILSAENAYIQNADVQQLLDVSPATASRLLTALTKEGKLMQIRNGRYWTYKLPDYHKSRN